MSNLHPTATGDSDLQTVRKGRRGVTVMVVALPVLAVTGILVAAWNAGVGDTCGGPVPGCGSLRNAGDTPVTVRAVNDHFSRELLVQGGERVLLGDWINDVKVDPGQCLTVAEGPFWDARTVIDRATEGTGVWHRVDDWGARVQLYDGTCPDVS